MENCCQDEAHNRQNNRWLAVSPKDVPRVMKVKFPAHIMVLGVIRNGGHSSLGLKKLLQEDHTCFNKIPHCNVLDYYLWDVVERITNKSASNNKGELKNRICQAHQDLSSEVMKSACSRFQGCSEVVINAKGGFIE
ncbi:hypothetical protein ANTPLA_LOCUS1351 [Anthophora plagiata]